MLPVVVQRNEMFGADRVDGSGGGCRRKRALAWPLFRCPKDGPFNFMGLPAELKRAVIKEVGFSSSIHFLIGY